MATVDRNPGAGFQVMKGRGVLDWGEGAYRTFANRGYPAERRPPLGQRRNNPLEPAGRSFHVDLAAPRCVVLREQTDGQELEGFIHTGS